MSYLAIGAALLLGLLTVLKFVAPRTKTLWDDRAEKALETVEPQLEDAAKS